mmetsp:Transcript_26075/g.47026  ORF Transcript_26075/g.47026 Transcript_26075/m.47026 type:complete len:209 (-) Transcript_26075:989-1615(-)
MNTLDPTPKDSSTTSPPSSLATPHDDSNHPYSHPATASKTTPPFPTRVPHSTPPSSQHSPTAETASLLPPPAHSNTATTSQTAPVDPSSENPHTQSRDVQYTPAPDRNAPTATPRPDYSCFSGGDIPPWSGGGGGPRRCVGGRPRGGRWCRSWCPFRGRPMCFGRCGWRACCRGILRLRHRRLWWSGGVSFRWLGRGCGRLRLGIESF